MGNLLKNGGGCIVMLFGGALLIGMFSGGRPVQKREAVSGHEARVETVDGVATTGTPATTDPVQMRLQDDVSITLKVSELPSRHSRIEGTTNLPSGTNLMLGVKERVPGGFNGSSKCVVADDGSFESESFAPNDGFPDGIYFATVLMPISRVQPDSVKRIIGNSCEYLSGPLVHQDSIGVTASTESEFSISDTSARSSQHKRTREMLSFLKRVRTELTSTHKELVNHSPYLESENLDDKSRWGSFARQFTVRIQEIRSEIDEAFPATANEARFHAGLAAGNLLSVFLDTVASGRSTESATEQYRESLDDLDQFIDTVDMRVTGEHVQAEFDAASNNAKGAGAVDEKAMRRAGSYIAMTKQLIQSGKAASEVDAGSGCRLSRYRTRNTSRRTTEADPAMTDRQFHFFLVAVVLLCFVIGQNLDC